MPQKAGERKEGRKKESVDGNLGVFTCNVPTTGKLGRTRPKKQGRERKKESVHGNLGVFTCNVPTTRNRVEHTPKSRGKKERKKVSMAT